MTTQHTDIAIIGMAGLFPKAPDIATFWSNILGKVDAIDEPLPEWGARHFLQPESNDLAHIYTNRGGFLRDLSRFDPRPFGIMPVVVAGSEPDHFHALDLAAQALADANLRDYDPASIGVILGHGIHAHRANMNGIQVAIIVDQTLRLLQSLYPDMGSEAAAEIRRMLKAKLPALEVDAMAGLVPNVMTGRIANRLNLMGPNYIIDAACASSLIAVESAMIELQRRRADVMLAGGVNTSTSPLVYSVFCALGALSRSSRIRPFDAQADGTLLGEGAGILVLKRLADALEAGDRVYAVLKAIGQSSDGKALGVMAPRLEGEVLAIRRAYAQAGIDPATVGLVEAHGTGIPLGDRTEVAALRTVWGERRRRLPHIAVGSIKSMIGHCIPAAGIASLIKMALALYHRVLPPTLCDAVSPDLGFETTPFYVNTQARPWIHGAKTPRRAGVNAFGFGGVNSHALLEEPPGREDPLGAFLPRAAGPQLFLLEDVDRPGLEGQVRALSERAGVDAWAGLPAQVWAQRRAGVQRLAILADDPADLRRKLELVADKLGEPQRHGIQARNGVYFTDQPLAGKVAFLFPGENSQYPQMLAPLAVRFPAVRRWFDFLDGLFAGEREIDPREAIFPPPTGLTEADRAALRDRLMDMELGSESVFAADQGLFVLLTAFGLRAHAMLGHSTGENAALVASGWPRLTEPQVGDYIRQMNALYREFDSSGTIPEGVLLSVGATTLDAVQAALAAIPGLVLAMDNCTNQFILFGPEDRIAEATGRLKVEGAVCTRLALARGYHTPDMAPMAQAFRALFEGIEFAASSVVLYSCVTAAPFPAEREGILETASLQYMNRVRFRESIERLYTDGVRVFVEVGPSGHLSAFVRDILKDRPHLVVSSNDRNRDAWVQLQHLLGRLFVHGMAIDLDALIPAVPSPARTKPYLPTSLPLIELDRQEAERVRRLLAVDAGPAATTAQPGRVPGVATDRARAVTDHLDLMQDFLAQQERVMAQWLHQRRHRKG